MILLSACTPGPVAETLVDELRVMAIVAEPMEVVPGGSTTLTVHVADPRAEDPEGLVWVEAPVRADPVDGVLQVAVAAPDAAGVAPAWALVCAAGLCGVMEEEDPDVSDPEGLVARYPLEGVSLALGGFLVADTPVGLTNPVLTPAFDALAVAPGGRLALPFAVEGGETAYGYGFAGGFGAIEYPVADGAATLEWYAPEEAGDVELIVVVNGTGTAVWRGTATVR